MKRLSMVILICIKQHLSNIWSSIYENVLKKVELKKVLLIKKACSQVTMPSIVGHAYMSDKHYMPCLKIKNICLGKNNANIYNKQIYNKKINWMKIDFCMDENYHKNKN